MVSLATATPPAKVAGLAAPAVTIRLLAKCPCSMVSTSHLVAQLERTMEGNGLDGLANLDPYFVLAVSKRCLPGLVTDNPILLRNTQKQNQCVRHPHKTME